MDLHFLTELFSSVLSNPWFLFLGTWAVVAGTIGTTVVLGGGAYLATRGGDEDEMSQEEIFEREFEERKKPATFLRAPEFPEAVGARKSWWEELQEGYLPEDWGDIWERAKQKYSQYYWGGPGGEPGVAAKVKAGAARRGVAESPAGETMLGRMGMEEAGGLKDIDIAEITGRMGERQNWFQQLQALASQRVPGAWDKYGGMAVAQPTPTESPWSELIGVGAQYLGQQAGQRQQQKWWEDLMKKQRTMPESILG